MSIDEKTLILKAQNGDTQAEAELLHAYSPLVKSIAHSYYVIGVDNEDLVQLGMIAMINAVRKFDINDGTASFKTYASTCIRNIINTAHKQNNKVKDSTPLSDIIDLPSAVNVEEGYEEKETARLLMSAISSVLTDCEMSVLKLYLSAMSYQEISDKLGLEKKKVDNTIYSFKKKIKKLLEKE